MKIWIPFVLTHRYSVELSLEWLRRQPKHLEHPLQYTVSFDNEGGFVVALKRRRLYCVVYLYLYGANSTLLQ